MIVVAVLAMVLACAILPAWADKDSSESSNKDNSAPEVITTLTPAEKQRVDRMRPEYLQPTPVEGEPQPTAMPMQPADGETIAFIGNGLASRMEHFNFFETALQRQFAGKNLTFRNLGFPGHTPAFRPEAGRKDPWAFPEGKKFRPEINRHFGEGHYPKPDEWLTIVKADTIVAFFGLNESYDGPDRVENFRDELRAFVDHTLSRSYARSSKSPRLVLVTPIAMQQLPGYLLPDAGERNALLEMYATAVGDVAREKKVGFVDLFTPTKAWFEQSTAPLTINGIHLSSDGYRKLAPLLMRELFGSGSVEIKEGDLLHKAVQDKSWFWNNDYRMLNGVHAYGRRWEPYGNFNYPEEIEKIRQMTVLRDHNIWAVAQGKSSSIEVDDSRTRDLTAVETNFAISQKNGTRDFIKSEKEALEKFTLPDGYEVSLFASEQDFPNLGNPVQMRFDNRGRLWVSTLPSYPHYKPGDQKPNDKILIYEDTDGDGRADRETVFADGLHMPIGFDFAPDGVYVSQEPYVVRLQDTDGDDRADRKEYLLDGFDSHDTHHAISSFDVDHGGGIYMCEGRFLHSQIETPWGPERMTDGGIWRFDPTSWKVERVMQTDLSNPWGVVHDEYGQTFVNDASPGLHYWMLGYSIKIPHSREIAKVAKFNYEHHCRPTSGSEFIYSRHFPEEDQGDYIYANTIGFLGIKQYDTIEDDTQIKGRHSQDLIQSSDGNFRPCDLEIAPDGSLYFVDWHNTLIGHMQHSARDPLRNAEYGRIYRITCKDRALVEPATVAGASMEQLFENLKLPELNSRKRSHRELRGRDKAAVLAAASTFAGQNSSDERLVLEALWATWGQNAPSEELLNTCLAAEDHRVRAAAVRVVRHCLHILEAPNKYLLKAAADEHPRVRLEALSAASWLGGDSGADILLTVASQETDPWIRNALNSAMWTLKSNVKVALQDKRFGMDDLTVDYNKLAASRLQGAVKPKNYRTKSEKFGEKRFEKKYKLGERVFHEEGSCSTCHQDHGEGVVRIYPPLAGSEWVSGDDERLIKLTLHGVWGTIQVKGKEYRPDKGVPPMTAVGNMFSDEEVAAVLSYVRSSWGNDSDEITAEQVGAIRAATRDRRKFYDPAELIEMHPFPEGSRMELVEEKQNKALEAALQAEPLADLVRDALAKGDAIRGAKLFYSQKTGCATCHDSAAEYQLGPALTTHHEKVTNEYMVNSILNPSSEILAGYQSVNVYLDDGRTVSGLLVEETDDNITLSLPAEGGKRRTISSDEVDEVDVSSVSTMPAGLAALLKDRDEFLDLAKFILDVNKGGEKQLRALKRQAKVKSP